MTRPLLDTGPLVAFLNRNDQWHTWARTQMGALPPPILTAVAADGVATDEEVVNAVDIQQLQKVAQVRGQPERSHRRLGGRVPRLPGVP